VAELRRTRMDLSWLHEVFNLATWTGGRQFCQQAPTIPSFPRANSIIMHRFTSSCSGITSLGTLSTFQLDNSSGIFPALPSSSSGCTMQRDLFPSRRPPNRVYSRPASMTPFYLIGHLTWRVQTVIRPGDAHGPSRVATNGREAYH
jgi:hypothetical protein